MNFNVSADDIKTPLRFEIQWASFAKFSRYIILCSVHNKVHGEVTWTLESNSKRLRWLSKYSLGTLIAFLEKLMLSLDPPKNSMKCFMEPKFRPYSRITFIFSWLGDPWITGRVTLTEKWLFKNFYNTHKHIIYNFKARGQEISYIDNYFREIFKFGENMSKTIFCEIS